MAHTVKFNEFDNTTPVTASDHVVGYGQVSGSTKTKRWLWSAVVFFLQGVLVITKLDRNATNHVEITGGGAGIYPKIEAVGGSSVIGINIVTKGSGSISIGSAPLIASGGSISVNGGNVVMLGGGSVVLGSGSAVTGSGVSLSAGGFVLTNPNVTLGGTSSLAITGSGTLTVGGGGGTLTIDAARNLSTTGDIESAATIKADTIEVVNLDVSSTTNFLESLTVGNALTVDSNIATQALSVDAISTWLADSIFFGDPMSAPRITTGNLECGSVPFKYGLTAEPSGGQGDAPIAANDVFSIFTTVATNGDACTLPDMVNDGDVKPVGKAYWITNSGGFRLDIYAAAGGSQFIEGLAAGAAYELAAGKSVIMICNGQDGASPTPYWIPFPLA